MAESVFAARQKSVFDTASGASVFGGEPSPEDQAAVLESQIAESGGSTLWDAGKTLGTGVLEALTAPGYAIAGTAEELFSPKGGGISAAPGRFTRELLSGLPGVELGAQRKGFSQIMQETGVGEMGSLSDIAPFLFSATGEGAALKKGGALDITGRGVIGTGLDVFTDPLTYVGNPASLFVRGTAKTGLKLAAKEAIPLLAEEAAKLSPHLASGAVDLARATARGRALAVEAAESVASKRAVAAAVGDSANELLAMGLRSNATDPLQRELYGAFRSAVKKEAQDRVLAAAAHAPELLHKGGRTFMGREIPGTVALSAALAGTSAPLTGFLAQSAPGRWALAGSKAGRTLLDDIGRIAVPAWWVRHSPDILEARANWRNMHAVIAGENAARLEATGFHLLSPESQAKVVAVREGAEKELTEAERKALDGIGSLMDDMRTQEIIAGVVPPGAAPAQRAAAKQAATAYSSMIEDVSGRRTALQAQRREAGRALAQDANATARTSARLRRTMDREGRAKMENLLGEYETERTALLSSDEATRKAEMQATERKIANAQYDRAGLEKNAPRATADSKVATAREVPGLKRAGYEVIQPAGDRFIMVKSTHPTPRTMEAWGNRMQDLDAELERLANLRTELAAPIGEHSQALTDLSHEYAVTMAMLSGGTPAEIERAVAATTQSGIRTAQGVYQSRVAKLDTALKDLGGEEALTRRIALQQAKQYIREQGLLGAATTGRSNYFPIIAGNSEDELALIVRNIPTPFRRGSAHDITSLGRFNELRHFDSRAEWLAYNAKDRAANPWVPELKLQDPVQSALQRVNGHASAMSGKGYADEIATRFAVDVPKAAYDLKPSQLSGALKASEVKEYLAIKEAVAKGGTELPFVAGLSDQGKKEFLRQRISRATSDRETANIIRKYGDFAEHLPQRTGGAGLAFDGTPFVPFDVIPELRGKLIPQSLANDLAESGMKIFHNPALNRMLSRLDSINNFMRTTVYSIFPSSQFRNKYSNVATGAAAIGISYLDPRLQKDMLLLRYPKLRAILGDTGGITTRTGEKYYWAELEDLFHRNGVYTSGRAVIEQTGSALTKGPTIMHKLAGALENQDRAALALHYLRDGKDINETARLVNGWQVDYTDLTAFDREILRRTFLFPTYARKMIPNLAKAISENPGRMSNMVRLFRGRESENQQMTSWEGGAFKVRLDRDGKNLTVLTGIDLPVRQLDLLWRGSISRTALGAVGMMIPALKAPMEIGFKTSAFTGRPFGRAESASIGRLAEQLPLSVQGWIGYKKEADAAGRPKYTFDGQRFYMLFQSYAISRMISTSDRQFRDYLNDGNWVGTMLDLSTGLRFKTLNLDEQQKRMVAERLRLLHEAAVRRGLQKEFTSTYTPKEGR